MASPIPSAALSAPAPTSRSIFRLVARCVDATNREADTLRHSLLSQWEANAGTDELVDRLRELDRADPSGELGVEARLAIWFTHADPGDGRLVRASDPVLGGLSDELREHLAGVTRPAG